MEVSGTSRVWIRTPENQYIKNIEVIVSPSLPEEEQMLLGLPALIHLHLLPKDGLRRRFQKILRCR